MSDDNRDIFYLEELPDYKVASDYPDVRGWEIMDADNRYVGRVSNLLVSKKQERVVYLDVDVDKSVIEEGYQTYGTPAVGGVHGFLNKEGDDHLIVPIGMVKIDEAQQRILASEINHATFAGARRFPKGAAIERDYELSLYRHYSGKDAATGRDET